MIKPRPWTLASIYFIFMVIFICIYMVICWSKLYLLPQG